MSRLGMLYALNEEDVKKLRSVPEEERYEYMLEEIEEALIGSPRSCELDKAWEGIQYCLGGGQWNEDNCIPTNIVFGGEGLFNTVITGPGHVWLQTMPISSVADSLRPYFPTSSK